MRVFVPLAVHECVHYQQVRFPVRNLLDETLHEGAADFVSYLVTGKMMERIRALHTWANAREREIWLQFKDEMNGQNTKGWLFGDPKPGWPDDVGYWLGFKICESYYVRAEDKPQALKDILTMTNAKAFLAAGHYSEKFGDAMAVPQHSEATPGAMPRDGRTDRFGISGQGLRRSHGRARGHASGRAWHTRRLV